MKSDKLPSILIDDRGSISMERALKQIIDLLENHMVGGMTPELENRVNASLDDVETMLKRII